MKKIMILAMVVVVALVASAGSAFAATAYAYKPDSSTLGTTSGFTLQLKVSKNVLIAASVAGAGTMWYNYTIATYHKAGSRTFATSNASQALYYVDYTGEACPAANETAGGEPTWGTFVTL